MKDSALLFLVCLFALPGCSGLRDSARDCEERRLAVRLAQGAQLWLIGSYTLLRVVLSDVSFQFLGAALCCPNCQPVGGV